jgi:hypothetical protein
MQRMASGLNFAFSLATVATFKLIAISSCPHTIVEFAGDTPPVLVLPAPAGSYCEKLAMPLKYDTAVEWTDDAHFELKTSVRTLEFVVNGSHVQHNSGVALEAFWSHGDAFCRQAIRLCCHCATSDRFRPMAGNKGWRLYDYHQKRRIRLQFRLLGVLSRRAILPR